MTGQDTVKKLIVGEEDGKEEENEAVSVRSRFKGDVYCKK